MSIALVTGASSGIGEAFARLLSRRGYHLLLVARREDRLRHLAQELKATGGSAEILPANLISEEEVESLCRIIHHRRIDLLVNNAGFGLYGPVTETSDSREQDMIQLHVNTPVRLNRAVLPQMTHRHSGGIILVGSTASFLPTPYMTAYGAAKAFILHYGEALHAELKETGVNVTTLCPGSTSSEFATRAGFRQTRQMSAEQVANLGLSAWEKGRPVMVTGTLNRWITGLPRILPRSWMTRLVAHVFRDRT